MSEELKSTFQRDYGQSEPCTITLLQDGQAGNKTYLAESEGGKTILKVYGDYWRDKVAWIQNEIEFLLFLDKRCISVATPLAQRDSSFVGTLESSDQNRSYVAYKFIEVTMEWPLGETKAHILGGALARLHIASSEFMIQRSWREYDIDRLVDRPLERMLSYLVNYPKETSSLLRLSEQIKGYLSQIPRGSSEYGPIHGDIHQGNVHFGTQGNATFFDFSLCGIGWRAYDFTGFLWPMRDETINDPAMRLSCDSFLAGYRSVREMDPNEEAAIPAFVKIRDIWETGDWLECGENLDSSVVAKSIVALVKRFEATPLLPI